MTGRIEAAFAGGRRPLLVGYTVAGDPDPAASIRIGRAILDGGADILELGLPFSDPVADGPVIQRAGQRALAAGATVDGTFAIAREVRAATDRPIVLLTYANPVFRRGIGAFYRQAKEAGIDGILIADLPLEEADGARAEAERNGIDQILLAAPTTGDVRLREILAAARGFLYLVSRTGVTGTREELPPEVLTSIRRVSAQAPVPVAVGFGISRPGHVRACTDAGADAAIVGSAIVGIVERNLADPRQAELEIREFVQEMKQAGRGAQQPG